MSNNVSLYIHEKLYYVQAVLCTFILIVYIYMVKSFSESIMLRRSSVDDHMSLVSLRPIPLLLIYTHITNQPVSVFISKRSTLTVTVVG